MGTRRLSAARPQLWIADVGELARPGVARACLALLDATERQRNQRFVRPEDRWRDLLTRALVRSVLSMYALVAPEDWRFALDGRGRPHVTHPAVEAPYFSLSHAGSMVACVVAQEPCIGVDVERVDPAAVVRDALPPRERVAVRSPGAFFSYWTLREAHAKATGLGLTNDSHRASFELAGDQGATLIERGQPARNWWFHRLTPAPGYVLAVALRHDLAASPALVWHTASPLPEVWR